MVLSPGVPIDHDIVSTFSLNVPIWGEVELAYFRKGKVIAI